MWNHPYPNPMIETPTHSNFSPERLRGVGSSKRSGTHLQADSTTLRGGLRLCFLLDCFCSLSRKDERIHLGAWRWRFSMWYIFLIFLWCELHDKKWLWLKFSYQLFSQKKLRLAGIRSSKTPLRRRRLPNPAVWVNLWLTHAEVYLDLFGIFRLWLSIAVFGSWILTILDSACINWAVRDPEPVSGASRQVGEEAIAWILAVAWHRNRKTSGVFQETMAERIPVAC